MTLTTSIFEKLESHGIELWWGYLVDIYSINGTPGESFISLDSFDSESDLDRWLGY